MHAQVSEEDFQSLKNEQGILVDFASFPMKIITLLDKCTSPQPLIAPRCALHHTAPPVACKHALHHARTICPSVFFPTGIRVFG